MAPAVVMRPTWLAPKSVNQRFPSGPGAIPMAECGAPPVIEKTVPAPGGVMGSIGGRFAWGDPTDAMTPLFGEPQVAVGARCDSPRRIRRDRAVVLDMPRQADACDLARCLLREPQVAVGSGGDAKWLALGGECELSDDRG